MSLDEALFERRAMYSPDRAVLKYVNEYGKKEFIDGYNVGYIDGLNAARKAVDAVQGYDLLYFPSQIIIQQDALTAIDVLQKEYE